MNFSFFRIFSVITCTVAVASLLTSCSDPSFTVKGNIADADGKTLLLQRPDHAGLWISVDSTRIGKDGKFKFSRIAPEDPEIYRLCLDGEYVYFPVDSVETLTVEASALRFASDFTLSGSEDALALGEFEKDLIAAAPIIQHPDSASAFKRRVYTKYLQNARGSVVSYYILTKTVNDEPLFRLPDDSKYFAAVATAFRQYRPDDPRIDILTETATRHNRRPSAQNQKVIEAPEISLFDIKLPDTNGNEVALSAIAGKGEPTILIFSDLSSPMTPALNAELRKLTGVRIYNVGLDDDQLAWRNAAINLPWTNVYANDTETRRIAAQYQISTLPTIFIVDAAGNLKTRCSSIADIRKNL